MKLGYDYIIIETNDLVSFLKEVKSYHLIIFHLQQIDHQTYSFYTPIYQRYILKKLHLSITRSVGILHYLCLIFNMPHILFTLAFVLSLMMYPRYIYRYQIEGTNPAINHQLELYLQRHVPYFHPSLTYKELNQLYDQIQDTFYKKIDYLNIYQNGSVVHVKYTNAVNNKTQTLDYHDYIAKSDGVICKVDVKKGNVVVKVNQFVQKGDVLISHLIEGTDNKTKIIPTQGQIYAYTYKYYQMTYSAHHLSKEGQFEYLLFQIRMQLPTNVKIDKEKVIYYGIIDKKIVLKMQYVFVENIAVKEKS